MAKHPKNLAASVRQRLLDLARKDRQAFDVVLVAFGLERLIYRLSVSNYRDRFVLKGGMLVTLWTEDTGRFTRDVDFLAFGPDDEDTLKGALSDILSIDAEDGLVFDKGSLTATVIREEQVYGGMRLKTTAYLGNTKIPITIDIGFGDALGDPEFEIDYTSLLDFPPATVRAYSPETVIAEKFQAVVALGVVNGRMKDFYDLWAIRRSVDIDPEALRRTIENTFERRETEVPKSRPPGLTLEFATDPSKRTQWSAYAEATELEDISLAEIVDDIWGWLEPVCLLVQDGS